MPKDIPEEEILKWLGKIEPLVNGISPIDEKANGLLENMKAYIADSKHFLEQQDKMRAFEAVIWAWAIYETCTELGVFQINTTTE